MGFETKYIRENGKKLQWDDSKIHTVNHALHYGTAVFEGIRIYQTEKGPKIFRLTDHMKRFVHSMQCININTDFSINDLNEATKELIKINGIENGYIRPIAWYGSGKMGLNPAGAEQNISISVRSWGKYLSENPINVCISSYIRPHPQSAIMTAKISGYYINSVFANTEAKANGYDEALLLDNEGNVAEGPGENIFFIKDKYLYTPNSKSILPGITRDTITNAVAKDLGYIVEETSISPNKIQNFDEAFFVGTAAEVTPIQKIQETNGNIISYSADKSYEIADYYQKIVTGQIDKYKYWNE
ncbi:branched-chain amino acid transaminase [Candidatus Absconditicoccus praedator]|uniref:branched-chain amino acid transaminase n=1 Tax=Candidatus Absconditicoccus praedator TaxID=2735562 RepID=UPI001E52E485|nr:branched-chain amino acid transaminase [Candidatus Absconditicoccus praedator]UFX83480.1 branched-chain amino acid transaminase [Candidatus Absconditicoccus praedator]